MTDAERDLEVRNLVMLVRLLAHGHPDKKLREKAVKYLKRESLEGSVLRAPANRS
jgi:hypothetical protein